MTELRVFYIDLISYVRTAEAMWVLMPSTSFVDGHTPYLIYQTSAYAGGEAGLAGGRHLSSWHLASEELEIPGGQTPLDLGEPVLPAETMPRDNDTRFDWVTKASWLISQGKVNGSALDSRAGNLVAARMKLTHGKLETFQFSTVESDGSPGSQSLVYAYFFARDGAMPNPLPPSRPMVNITVWRVNLPDNSVTIHSKDFGNRSTRMLKLETREPTLDVVVGNLGYLQRNVTYKMAHFYAHYPLAQGWSPATPSYLPFKVLNNNKIKPRPAIAVHGNRPFPSILKHVIDPVGNGDIRIDKEACPHWELLTP